MLSRHNVQQLAPRWQMMIGQFYASSATEADGRLFTCSNLYGSSALAPTTGEFLWSRSNAAGGDCDNPALSQGVAYLASSSYTPSRRNLLSAVDQATGQAQWTAELPADPDHFGVVFGPAVDGGRVFLSTGRDAIVAVDAGNGSVLWQASTGGGVVLNNDVAVADGRVFATTWHVGADRFGFGSEELGANRRPCGRAWTPRNSAALRAWARRSGMRTGARTRLPSVFGGGGRRPSRTAVPSAVKRVPP